MIAVDTNVLVRYVTNDDPEQARKAVALLSQEETVLVAHTVLLELEWVLRSAYGLDRPRILAACYAILGLKSVHIDKPMSIANALSWYGRGMDLGGALHLATTDSAERFLTFDRRFARRGRQEGLLVELV